jgi:hypothetical protein
VSREALLEELAELQAQLGLAIRTPLDATTGTYRADPERYEDVAALGLRCSRWGSAREGLAVYNRQYWFRLFTAAQDLYPLTARLVGLFRFNALVQSCLAERPPREPDLTAAVRDLARFLESSQSAVEAPLLEAVVQAARIDEAWANVWLAEAEPVWRPSPEEAAELESARLVRRASVALVAEAWPLVVLRRTLSTIPGEGAVPLPPRLDGERWWAIVRTDDGVLEAPLSPGEALLLRLLETHTLGDALVALERRVTGREGALAPQVRRWLARSVELGFWRTVRFG